MGSSLAFGDSVWRLGLCRRADCKAIRSAMVGIVGYLGAAVLAGTLFHVLWRLHPSVEAQMPLFSMFGIIFFTAITTATGRDELLDIGKLLVCVSVLHNLIGLVLGYWLARLLGLDEKRGADAGFGSRHSKWRDGLGPGERNEPPGHGRPRACGVQPLAECLWIDPRKLLAEASAGAATK